MDYNQLFEQIKAKKSLPLCRLRTRISLRFPPHLLQLEDPVFEFNKPLSMRRPRWLSPINPISLFMKAGVSKDGKKSGEDYTLYPDELPDIFTIADAKRGISEILLQMYAKSFSGNSCFRFDHGGSLYGRRFGDSFPAI